MEVWSSSHLFPGRLQTAPRGPFRTPIPGQRRDGRFLSYSTVLFGVGSGPLVRCKVPAWVVRSTQAWLGADRAQTNCFVDGPIIALRGTTFQRRRLAMEMLLWWRTLGLKLAYEKGSFGPEAVWIGTHFTVKSVVNKVSSRRRRT